MEALCTLCLRWACCGPAGQLAAQPRYFVAIAAMHGHQRRDPLAAGAQFGVGFIQLVAQQQALVLQQLQWRRKRRWVREIHEVIGHEHKVAKCGVQMFSAQNSANHWMDQQYQSLRSNPPTCGARLVASKPGVHRLNGQAQSRASASMGSNRAALRAGTKPNSTPIRVEQAKAVTMEAGENTISHCLTNRVNK